MRISKIGDFCVRKARQARVESIEFFTAAGYLIELMSKPSDVFTPQDKSQRPDKIERKQNRNAIFKEHFEGFKTATNRDNNHKEDVFNNPKLCNQTVLMCIDTYDKKQSKLDGWTLDKTVRNYDNGFCANVYKKGDEIAVAFGATNDKKDVLTDVQMAKGEMPNQYEDALKLFKELREENPEQKIILTGTSLGGSIAGLLASYDENTLALTYNGYGIARQVEDNPELKDNHNSYNYTVKFDVVSRTTPHIGEVIEKMPSAFIRHSISNYLGYFKED